MVAFRKAVIARTADYVTSLSTILMSDFETIVFLKKEVMMVLSNAGGTGNTYSLTIPMGKTFPAGTEFTDIIGCGKGKVASTGDFVTSVVKGMPQVHIPPIIPLTITYSTPSLGDDLLIRSLVRWLGYISLHFVFHCHSSYYSIDLV
jgi:hypothetical protein